MWNLLFAFCSTNRFSRYLQLVPFAAENFTRDTSGGCPVTRIPQAVPLVMSRRLIKAVRNEGVPLFERAKISFPVSLFIPAVGDQCPGMFSDTRSIFRCLSRATGLSLSLSRSRGVVSFLCLLLLLNHLDRRRRFS